MTSPLPVWWGVVFGGLAFAGFSVHDALAKTVLVFHHPFWVVAGMQTAMSCILAVMWWRRSRAQRVVVCPSVGTQTPSPRSMGVVVPVEATHPQPSGAWELKGLLALRVVFAAVSGLCVSIALSLLPLGAFYTLVFCMPVVAVVLSMVFNKEFPSRLQWWVMAMACVGVCVAFPPFFGAWQAGHGWAMGAVLSSAGGIVCTRRLGPRVPALLVAWSASIGSAVVAAVALWWMIGLPAWPPVDLLAIWTIGGVVLAGAQWMLARGLQVAPVSVVMPMQYTQWVWGLVLGWALWREVPLAREVVGAAVVVVAGMVLWRAGRKAEASPV